MTTTSHVASRLANVLEASHVVTAPEELAAYAIDDLVPSAIVRPASAAEVAELVRFAAADKLAIVPLGSRSKCDVGMPISRYDIAVDLTMMREVAHYDAGDLTLSVDAGIPLRELEPFLRRHGQFLPLAVPCFESTTAGGTVASGIDSALRMQYGSARDFLIGAEFVDGTGQLCRSGGRVVKNVTGYDLHKLLIGSLGTLGIITRVNFRTFPLPDTSAGHWASFPGYESALAYRKSVEDSGLPLANLEVLSPEAATLVATNLKNIGVAPPVDLEGANWCVSVLYEGNEDVVRRITDDLQGIAREARALANEALESAARETFGGQLREAFDSLRWSSPDVLVCRIAIPEVTPQILAELSYLVDSAMLRPTILVRAAGVIYFGASAEDVSETSIAALTKVVNGVKALAARLQGDATILHASSEVKARAVANSNVAAKPNLGQRVKQAFDPAGMFAPGRIVGGL
jgi:glycolate dehydrogenase FAD-binding subunit